MIRERGYCLDCSAAMSLREEVVGDETHFFCVKCSRLVKRKALPVYPQPEVVKADESTPSAPSVDPSFVHDWAAAAHAAIEKEAS